MKALGALDTWKDKEAELRKKKPPELKKLWAEAQRQPDAPEAAATDGAPTEDAGTEP